MEKKVFNSVNDFFTNFKANTLGLNVITFTKPTLKSKKSYFNNFEITKITAYKNIVCGASYNSILFQHIKKDIIKTENDMITNFNNFLNLVGIEIDTKPMFQLFFKGLNKIIFKAKKKQINLNFQEPLPWGQWVKYPLLISHNDKNYIRMFKNDDLTKIKTYYFINGNLITENSDLYQKLINELKTSTLPNKQKENGIRNKVIPMTYNIENIVYLRQGNKIYQKYDLFNDEEIKLFFKGL